MSMAVSAVRFEPHEKEWIESFAAMNGLSFSAQVRRWALERLEDELDAHDLRLAVEEARANPADTGVPLDEIMTKHGLA